MAIVVSVSVQPVIGNVRVYSYYIFHMLTAAVFFSFPTRSVVFGVVVLSAFRCLLLEVILPMDASLIRPSRRRGFPTRCLHSSEFMLCNHLLETWNLGLSGVLFKISSL